MIALDVDPWDMKDDLVELTASFSRPKVTAREHDAEFP
jgi:hypothetical protein